MSRRVLIFGNSGSGKSTRAKALADEHAMAHLDLDTLAWDPVERTTRRPLAEANAEMEGFRSEHASWVVEGCYADLIELLLPHASELLFLDLDVETCVAHCRSRPFEPHKYASQEAQDENLAFLIEWVRGYPEREGPLGRPAHLALYEAFPGKKERITKP